MATIIRPAQVKDLELILQINNAATPAVNNLEFADIQHFMSMADYFSVSVTDGKFSGFLIALSPECDYQSINYRWFQERYPEFLYIDRVVVSKDFRGCGIGSIFYADVQSFCEQQAPLLTCEVNIEPRNDISLLFHGTHGFQEVGQQVNDGGGKRVSLLAKELPAFEYVRTRYLNHDLHSIKDKDTNQNQQMTQTKQDKLP